MTTLTTVHITQNVITLVMQSASQSHQSVLKISGNTGIRRSSVGRIMHDLFTATATHALEGKQCA